jgi:hypothetical protein
MLTTLIISWKGSISKWMQHDVEEQFLELNDFCPDAATSFPPSIGVKT